MVNTVGGGESYRLRNRLGGGELLRDPRTFPEVALGVVPPCLTAHTVMWDAENVRILSADNAPSRQHKMGLYSQR